MSDINEDHEERVKKIWKQLASIRSALISKIKVRDDLNKALMDFIDYSCGGIYCTNMREDIITKIEELQKQIDEEEG